MTQGYTYVDDGWTSRAKKHLLVSLICRPGTPAHYVGIHAVDCEELHGVATARFWEIFFNGQIT